MEREREREHKTVCLRTGRGWHQSPSQQSAGLCADPRQAWRGVAAGPDRPRTCRGTLAACGPCCHRGETDRPRSRRGGRELCQADIREASGRGGSSP